MEQGIDVVLEDEEVEVDAQTDFLKGDKGDKGDKGNKGDKGDKGDTGEKGDTGYTPVKGIDYYTDNEIQAIIKDITNAIEEKLEPQEQERQSNEQDRILGENTRIEKEIDRQAAELTRISNEEIRQNNENMRETQESEREETENRRMETFAQMEESVANAVNNIVDMTEAYNNNAAQKTKTFNDNATAQTNAFNENATEKTNEYNANAQAKLDEYNANAEALANRVVELETENEVLKNQIPTGQAEGENITLNDSAEMELKELKVSGNSWQETGDVTDEEGTVIGAMPSPEFPSEIKNVTGSANITVCNENLFDYKDFKSGNETVWTIEQITNGIKVSRLNSYSIGQPKTRLKNLKNNTTYTLNFTIEEYTGDIPSIVFHKNNTVVAYITKPPYTFTTDDDSTYDLSIVVSSSSYAIFTNIQLVEGSVATECQPHQSQNFTFPLSEGQRLMLGDYLADDGIHHKRGQDTINISNTTKLSNGNVGGMFTTPRKIYKANNNLIGSNIIFDKNRTFTEGTVYENQGNVVFVGNSEDTFETLKAKYDGGMLEYDLAEEVIEPYTEEQQIVYNQITKATSYKNITHIFSTDEISPVFDVTYRKDLETLFNNVTNAVIELGGTINV